MERGTAIFLTGPIGVGKSTIGCALAGLVGGRFVEGDDHQLPDRAWYAASLRTSRGILSEVVAGLPHGPVVAGYPLRCMGMDLLPPPHGRRRSSRRLRRAQRAAGHHPHA